MCPIGRNEIIGVARIISLLLAASFGFVSASAQTHRPMSQPQSSGGQTYSETVLHSFMSQAYDGQYPISGLIQDQSGNMYGATYQGGAYEVGSVFEVTPNGNGGITYNPIYAAGDGSFWWLASLSIDSQGNLYGTAGVAGLSQPGGVFELSQVSAGDWILSNLYAFGGDAGAFPQGALADSAGNVYGTTLNGGANEEGTIFELQNVDAQWLEQTIVAFGSTPSTGAYGNGNLLMDKGGNLYGTTAHAGAYGQGVVFKLHPTKTGWRETILHNFQGLANDGSGTNGQLIFGPDGNIYGTSPYGLQPGYGGVFQLTKSGKITWIWTFTGGADGTGTTSGVVFDKKGNLYGVSSFIGDGAVFKLSPPAQNQTTPWTFDLLYTFPGGAEGAGPETPFVFDNAGNIYGVTYGGGTGFGDVGYGTIFKLTPNPVAPNISITQTFPNPSVAGQVVKVNFAVAQTVAGYNVPSGTVTVNASTGEGCSAPLPLNGQGSCSLKFATAGTRELTASYSGDAGNLASVSSAVTENTMSLTTTKITKNTPDPAKIGQSVTVHFSVQAKNGTTQTRPTGSVTVNASTGESCTASIAKNGNGNCRLTFGSAGSRTLSATYAGDGDNAGSLSSAATETVE